ncbi:MAG: TIGR04053 family radical SAM/SPASM domain-containing protein [Vulcanimicrobiaceae bacterium]
MKPHVADDPMYDSAPRIVIWEMTRACALACRHCRAEAIPRRDSRELTTVEAFKLVDDVAACHRPLFVLTGGDPLMRDDIYKIVEYGTSLHLPMSVSPSATGRLTREAIRQLATAGVQRISLSLDAPDAATHDEFRGVKGSYQRTMEAIEHAHEYGVSVQINTTLAQHNRMRLMEFEEVLTPFDIALWSVFFVLPVGRAGTDLCLDAGQTEDAFREIHAIESRVAFDVKATEAPHYRRYALQHAAVPPRERPGTSMRAPGRFAGIGDGRGFVFISHRGDIQPSGFLALSVGNVREDALLDVYRNDPVMQRLRKPDTFDGKCGVCEFRRICGGSRARAFAASGNAFGSDPDCSYVPAAAAHSKSSFRGCG